MYVYHVKCVVCELILYINTLYSNSNVVGVFIANCRTVVSFTGSHPPPSLAAHEVVHPAARLCVCNTNANGNANGYSDYEVGGIA